MKYILTFCFSLVLSGIVFSQSGFQSTLQSGISLPVNKTDDSYISEGIHFGNHLDYLVRNGKLQFGLGGYAGYLNSFSADIEYKIRAEEIARKFGLASSQLSFNETAFKSFQLLIGPVLSFSKNQFSFNCWAKGGYGFNEPATYTVLYSEGNQVRNVYVNQSADNKNAFAYNTGAGFQYALSPAVGFQLAANYFATKTGQVLYHYEREQGTIPTYSGIKNNFVQASAGIILKFVNGSEGQRINKSKSNVKNNRNSYREQYEEVAETNKVKEIYYRKSEMPEKNDVSDTLVFNPQKIVLSTRRQTQKSDFGEKGMTLISVNNYLTGFVHQTNNGISIDQCGTGNDGAPSTPVTLTAADGSGRAALNTSTNSDGSFAFKNIEPGRYKAQAGNEIMNVLVKTDERNNYNLLSINDATCSNSMLHNIISINDTIFVEVVSPRDTRTGIFTGRVVAPRDAASGLPTGKRMHKPYPVSNTSFEISQKNIIHYNGKIYAEVTGSAEENNRVLIIGDIDGDGFDDHVISSPRDAASGLPTGKRMNMITAQDPDAAAHSVKSPRDAASGQATGKRMHKPVTIIIEVEEPENTIKSSGDASSGLATGKRMHKPVSITMEPGRNNHLIVAPRDMASGLPTGKRMHKPVTIRLELDENNHTIISPRDAASGMPTGKRTHKPIHLTFDLDEVNEAIVAPRDASSGLATGKRMHKPVSITINLDEVPDAPVKRDAASGLATGKRQHTPVSIILDLDANNNIIVAPRDPSTGQSTGKRSVLSSPGNSMNSDPAIVNPLYEGGATSGENPLFNKSSGNQSPIYDDQGKEKNNPLYSSSSSAKNKGENPLFEAKSDLRVAGSNGVQHTLAFANIIEVVIPANTLAGQQYNVMPVKWSAPDIDSQSKGINQAAVKKVQVRGWDVDKRQGIAITYILQTSRISCDAGYCTVDCVVEINGILYDAVISGNFSSIQDKDKPVMNLIK
jgi:hypothetical protein